MSRYTFTGVSTAPGTVNTAQQSPVQQSPAGTGFQLPAWVTGLFGTVTQVGQQAGTFLASDAGACWQAYPPFSGKGDLRSQCLERVASGQPYAVQYGIDNSGPNLAGAGNLLALGLGGVLLYQLIKK